MGKRRYSAEDSRTDILNAAEKLFAERGFGDVSTNRIAKEAGVSQSQIHYHFETKQKLWSEVFRTRFSDYFHAQGTMLNSALQENEDPMSLSIQAYFDFFQKNPLFVKLIGRAQLDGFRYKDTEPMASELMTQGIAAVEDAQSQGTLRKDVAPQFIMIGFLSMVTYWFQCREQYLPASDLTEPPESYDAAYLEFILKIYMKGIQPE